MSDRRDAVAGVAGAVGGLVRQVIRAGMGERPVAVGVGDSPEPCRGRCIPGSGGFEGAGQSEVDVDGQFGQQFVTSFALWVDVV